MNVTKLIDINSNIYSAAEELRQIIDFTNKQLPENIMECFTFKDIYPQVGDLNSLKNLISLRETYFKLLAICDILAQIQDDEVYKEYL